MIIIPNDLSGNYPKRIINLLKELKDSYLEEEETDRMYGSARYGCECGCGGDSWSDYEGKIMKDRDIILKTLLDYGYKISGEGY